MYGDVMASEKQVSFIESLLKKKDYDFQPSVRSLTKPEASKLIEALIAMPDGSSELVPEGMYRRTADSAIFRVLTAKTSDNRYAKKLDQENGGWLYEKGAIYSLKRSEAMTLEQAKEFGVRSGICCVCARTLTDEKSVSLGIGPVCAKAFG